MIFLDSLAITPLEMVLSLFIIVFAYGVKGLSGFGSGLIAIPLLTFIFPLTLVVPVFGLLSYSGTIMQGFTFWRQVKWADVLPVLPFSLLGIYTAVWVLANINEQKLIFVLGLFVLSYALLSLRSVNFVITNRFLMNCIGGLGGLVGALFGTGGPFYVMYLKAKGLSKSRFRATMVMIFVFDGSARIGGYALNGFYDNQTFVLLIVLSPVLLIGLRLGHYLHDKIDQEKFNLIINVLLSLSGLVLMLKSWPYL